MSILLVFSAGFFELDFQALLFEILLALRLLAKAYRGSQVWIMSFFKTRCMPFDAEMHLQHTVGQRPPPLNSLDNSCLQMCNTTPCKGIRLLSSD